MAHEVLGLRTRMYPVEGGEPVEVTALWVTGAVDDYAVYVGIGRPEWIQAQGSKLRFEEALAWFPHLDAARYRR